MACSLWARQVGKSSPAAWSASPMPATLPWPKIAQQPARKGCAVLVELAGEVADHGLGGGQADLLHAASPFRVRASSQRRQRRSYFPAISAVASASVTPPASQRRAVSAKMVRPMAKPLTSGWRAAAAKLAASSSAGASRPRTMMPRQQGSWRAMAAQALRPGGVGGHRLELPPVGVDAEGVEAVDEGGGGGVVDGGDLGGDDLEEELEAVGAGGAEEADEGRLLVGPHRGRRRRGGRSRGP